jgi:hypothetical protein
MADGQHKLSRRALLGAVCAAPVLSRHSGLDPESTFPTPAPDEGRWIPDQVRDDEVAEWHRALARFHEVQAILDAARSEPDEDAYDRLLDSHSEAPRRPPAKSRSRSPRPRRQARRDRPEPGLGIHRQRRLSRDPPPGRPPTRRFGRLICLTQSRKAAKSPRPCPCAAGIPNPARCYSGVEGKPSALVAGTTPLRLRGFARTKKQLPHPRRLDHIIAVQAVSSPAARTASSASARTPAASPRRPAELVRTKQRPSS